MEQLLVSDPITANEAFDETEPTQDHLLVQRILLGDENAFVEIVNSYYGKILGFALKLVRNAADAEDVAQETFIRAYRGISGYRGEASLSTWLHRIALNVTRNRYWYFFRRRRHDSISLDHPIHSDSGFMVADCIAGPGPSPAQDAVTSEFMSLISECMEELDEPHREILVMRNLRGLAYWEIAEDLGIGIGTVKSRIGRAREKLRGLLSQKAPDLTLTPSTRAECCSGHANGGLRISSSAT